MSLPSADPATAALRVNRLSESIYELYKPGDESLLDIVFFHGLQLSHTSDAHESTWRSRGSQKEVWPMTWLPEDFPRARILSVNYDACITRSAEHGRLDLHNTAKSLMEDLQSAKVGQHPLRPVVLVGHSYGGLVIKQLCFEAHMAHRQVFSSLLKCVKGVFFYGTPHHESRFFHERVFAKDAGPLSYYVKMLCAESACVHDMFDSLRLTYKWRIAGVGESIPTTFLTPEGKFQSEMIVHEVSARYCGGFIVEHEDHFSLCQPKSRNSNTYLMFTAFIQIIDINQVYKTRFLEVPKMAMILHSHLFRKVQNILRTAPAVALCGMGGIGKTTLAKLLFNELFAEFEYTCFVQLPKGKINEDYMKELEGRVYSSMHHHGLKVERRGVVWHSTDLTMKTLLLVLDDIDNHYHVQLLKHISSLNNCANSRYIVTTSRSLEYLNCNVTSGDRYIDADVFIVDRLNLNSSRELFISHAFPYPTKPSRALEDWIDKIVSKCDGVPLTLEVIGSSLKNVDKESIWNECLNSLDEANDLLCLDERLWAKLKVSYNRLHSEEKEMFLDAATFFNNSTWNLREAKSCWRVLYGSENLRWQTLVDLSLVYHVSEKDRIQMSEQMRSLGMKLALRWGDNRICRTWMKKYEGLLKNKGFPSTSSSTGMKIEDLLAQEVQDLVQEVIALRLEVSMPLNSTHVFQMQKLRYLDIEELDEAYFICPSSVVLLRLRGEGNSLEDLVKGHLPACLVALDLKAPLKCFPTIVTEIRGLEVMKFEACLFEGLPETFINFQKLRHLTFSSCNGLHSLPEDFGLLSELRYLELHYCYDFEALPNSFGNLHSLQILKIVSLHNLQRLPQDFGALSNLERLVISDAPKISELPDSFGELHRLQDLHLDNMSSLRALPYSFGNLSQLWRLSMVGCAMTKELPDSFGDLPNLTNLDFRDCRSAEVFPASMHVIRRLPRLRYLIVQTRESEGNLSESELRALWTGEQPIK